ncbi:hypothetical protein F1721_19950 [Saccharopolyspora hirsuta]|uniref:Class I SAM-dependent methyltransferase n=1 Tax=Saccharopolyspora hirsuta TaxID=1837 RepID=A0A5M7BXX1_SACHI|nr:hypothetical protein [Saccharopolyspora hirsuta]KAA5832074.1 hypothetical protein F1721_19950 [Saccharopolyspora hirsuta]
MQIANEHQAEAWNGYEGQHWADNRHRYDRVLDDSTGTLFEVAEIERGHRVPDVGCGTGKTTRPAARRAAHAFPAAHFDLAISRGGITYFADPVAAFGNIGGALKPETCRPAFSASRRMTARNRFPPIRTPTPPETTSSGSRTPTRNRAEVSTI